MENGNERNPARGPKTELAVGRSVVRVGFASGVVLGALLGANNRLAAILIVVAAVIAYVVYLSYRDIRKANVADAADYESARAATGGTGEPGARYCDDPNCVACSVRRALNLPPGAVIIGRMPVGGGQEKASGGLVH